MEKINIELENIEMTYLDRNIFTCNRLAIHQFDRIGIVGKNGAGKTTLLQLLAGKIRPTKGKVVSHTSFGYLEQMNDMHVDDTDERLLGQLNVPRSHDSLSGGEQTRRKIAQLLTHYHETILLDEPTSHLDQAGITFLIDELTYYYGALVIVSHDRFLLDQLVTTIWEIENGEINVYTGNYTEYEAQKQLEKQQQQIAYEQYTKEKRRLEKAANDKMLKAAKLTQSTMMSKKEIKEKPNRMFETKSKGTSQKNMQRAAKAIEQRIDQLDRVDMPEEESNIRFPQAKTREIHNRFPIMGQDVTISVTNKVLLEQASFQFSLGKKIAITGQNGVGKSMLLHHIIRNGENFTISPKAIFGVYKQQDYQFKQEETVINYLRSRSDFHESKIRAALYAMNFTEIDLKKSVKQLSGGEATRLVLSRLFLGKYNILLLDEPTNFLDIHCLDALERFITGYEGTVIFISHDRQFVKNVADHVYEIKNKKIVKM